MKLTAHTPSARAARVQSYRRRVGCAASNGTNGARTTFHHLIEENGCILMPGNIADVIFVRFHARRKAFWRYDFATRVGAGATQVSTTLYLQRLQSVLVTRPALSGEV